MTRSAARPASPPRKPSSAPGSAPRDVDCAEVHDASAPAELMVYEQIGFAEPGGGPALLASGRTRLDGRAPGQHQRRPAQQGSPDRRHRHRPDLRVDLAATRRSRRASGRGRPRRPHPERRRLARGRLRRDGRPHPLGRLRGRRQLGRLFCSAASSASPLAMSPPAEVR